MAGARCKCLIITRRRGGRGAKAASGEIAPRSPRLRVQSRRRKHAMETAKSFGNQLLPRVIQHERKLEGGTAIGLAQRWNGGQCCAIQTAAGIVGCGIYALDVPAEFDKAIAIARGTPAN